VSESEGGAPIAAEGERSTGLLPAQMLRAAVQGGGEVLASEPIGEDQIQPASIDLRLGEAAYRVRASFLPGARASVVDKLAQLSMHRIDLTGGAVLENSGLITATAITRPNGNFFTADGFVEYPARAFVSLCPDVLVMVAPVDQTTGANCNTSSCHTAGFRIHLP